MWEEDFPYDYYVLTRKKPLFVREEKKQEAYLDLGVIHDDSNDANTKML